MKRAILSAATLVLLCLCVVCTQASAKSAVKLMRVTVQDKDQEILKQKMYDYAAKNDNNIKYAQVRPDERYFIIEIFSVKADAVVHNYDNPSVFQLGTYKKEESDSDDGAVEMAHDMFEFIEKDHRFIVEFVN